MTYECWVNEEGTEISFFPSDHPQRDLNTTDVDGNPMKLSYTIEADTWEDAERQHYTMQGWPNYKSE